MKSIDSPNNIFPMRSFHQLLNDNRHGASYLFREFLHFLIKKSKTGKETLSLSEKMHKAHPSMAEFIRFYHRLEAGGGFKPATTESIRQEIVDLEKEQRRICDRAAGLLKKYHSIFTYSSSSLVFQTIIRLSKKTRIYLTESRPMMEGKDLARALSRKGYHVTFGVDAMAGEFIKEADVVLLGCDALTPTEYIHKIGTKAIVYLARQEKIPVFALATPQKVLNAKETRNLHLSENSTREVWDRIPRRVKIRNCYFEGIFKRQIIFIL